MRIAIIAHNGQLQISFERGAYSALASLDERNFAAANSALFLVAHLLIRLGYFLGLKKSILIPRKVVPYLGFLCDSSRVFPVNRRKRNF